MRFPPIHRLLPKLATAFITIVAASSTLWAQQHARHFEHQLAGDAKDGAVLWPMDILHQRIELNLALGSVIEGHCTITAVPRADGTTSFPLHVGAHG